MIPVSSEPCERTIDCGDIVWGLAFGSSVPEKQSRCVNIEWHRFKFGQDQLLLATGLNNGRIKIWDVYTGEDALWLIRRIRLAKQQPVRSCRDTAPLLLLLLLCLCICGGSALTAMLKVLSEEAFAGLWMWDFCS